MMNDEDIAAILKRFPQPSEACQALIDRALELGGKDNVTVIVANYRFEDRSQAETRPQT
jgi:serine/threonine protein phosphatase PrpC